MLVLRDLEGRPDDEIACVLGLQERPSRASSARRGCACTPSCGCRSIGAPCPGRLPALSAYADDTLTADERDELDRSRHRLRELPRRAVRAARGRAALPRAARARTARRARIAHRHGARRGRPGGAQRDGERARRRAAGRQHGGRRGDGGARGRRRRRHDRGRPRRWRRGQARPGSGVRPSPRHSRARRCPDSALALGRRQRAGRTGHAVRHRAPPPARRHAARHAHAPAHRARPSDRGAARPRASRSRPRARRSSRLAAGAAVSAGGSKPKPTPPVHDDPGRRSCRPPAAAGAQAASQASPDPPRRPRRACARRAQTCRATVVELAE